MRYLACLLLFIVAVSAFSQTNLENRIIGTWKYDTKTLQITLSARGKAELSNAGPAGAQRFNAMKGMFGKMMSMATVRFEPGHHFVMSLENPKTHEKRINTGTWSIKGSHVLVSRQGSGPPFDFTADKDFKHLTVTYSPAFGQGRITAFKVSK
jgi:hypothetical protein